MKIKNMSTMPIPQPPESSWTFIEDLKSPVHQRITWWRSAPKSAEADLRGGVSLAWKFPDEDGKLETICRDFERFLDKGNISRKGAYRIVTEKNAGLSGEAYRLAVSARECRIEAGDTEGIRRGIVFAEDEMLRAGGPFLPLGNMQRRPFVKTRISRCFFGPIKRPPKNRDELADDVDYYPDEYLNRLQHDGVNGLWLTIEWKDVVRSNLFPESGRDAARRLKKLRSTVTKCARFGIRIYVFCIEPAALPADSLVLRKHPELAGHRSSSNIYFCTSTRAGAKYVEDSVRNIFTSVPDLGGMIVISVGERATHCCSGGVRGITCPRCAKRKPWDVLGDTLAAMERGMHAVNPQAELISWPYSQYAGWGEKLTVKAAGHVPPRVILQQNFESGARAMQLGKKRYLGDYWLSFVGPSKVFADCARAAVRRGTRISAKLQVGCSHETATAPFVPVPGNLHGKYRAMNQLGVSAAMYSWYFGSYPSLMTRAAGELAFEPFPESEAAFLKKLAQRDWGPFAGRVVKAWLHFQTGYRQYPYSQMAGYYGPFHDGPVWPLYLIPRDSSLAPTWQIKFGLSGDRIGEVICYTHTPAEFQRLATNMACEWQRGAAIMKALRPAFRGDMERLRDIGVAEALGIQFESGMNILDFYLIRESLPFGPAGKQLKMLREMKALVRRELELDRQLLKLATFDSRLGFHSEAEGYKYFPRLIRWRMKQLMRLLAGEFPVVEKQIRRKQPLFAVYAGLKPEGAVYECNRFKKAPEMNGRPWGLLWDDLPEAECVFKQSPHDVWIKTLEEQEREERRTTWKAGHDGKHLYFGIMCREPDMKRVRDYFDDKAVHPYWDNDCAVIMLEPRRLWPCQTFAVNARGSRWQRWQSPDSYGWQVSNARDGKGWSMIVKIPFSMLREKPMLNRPMRMDIFRAIPRQGSTEDVLYRWMENHPLVYRLAFRRDNPADLGWLVFK